MVLSLDISKDYPHLVVAGLYDGNVAVYNLCRSKMDSALRKNITIQRWIKMKQNRQT